MKSAPNHSKPLASMAKPLHQRRRPHKLLESRLLKSRFKKHVPNLGRDSSDKQSSSSDSRNVGVKRRPYIGLVLPWRLQSPTALRDIYRQHSVFQSSLFLTSSFHRRHPGTASWRCDNYCAKKNNRQHNVFESSLSCPRRLITRLSKGILTSRIALTAFQIHQRLSRQPFFVRVPRDSLSWFGVWVGPLAAGTS
jgi:hypothetical protein